MKNVKSYSLVLALVASLALVGCGGGTDSSGNPTASPEDGIDYTTVGTDKAIVEYINPDENSFKITWNKESTGSSELELKDSKTDSSFFVVFAKVKPGTGVMECSYYASSSSELIFACNSKWTEDSGVEEVDSDFKVYFHGSNYTKVVAKYFEDKQGVVGYSGETFGTIEWNGSQLIVN